MMSARQRQRRVSSPASSSTEASVPAPEWFDDRLIDPSSPSRLRPHDRRIEFSSTGHDGKRESIRERLHVERSTTAETRQQYAFLTPALASGWPTGSAIVNTLYCGPCGRRSRPALWMR